MVAGTDVELATAAICAGEVTFAAARGAQIAIVLSADGTVHSGSPLTLKRSQFLKLPAESKTTTVNRCQPSPRLKTDSHPNELSIGPGLQVGWPPCSWMHQV